MDLWKPSQITQLVVIQSVTVTDTYVYRSYDDWSNRRPLLYAFKPTGVVVAGEVRGIVFSSASTVHTMTSMYDDVSVVYPTYPTQSVMFITYNILNLTIKSLHLVKLCQTRDIVTFDDVVLSSVNVTR